MDSFFKDMSILDLVQFIQSVNDITVGFSLEDRSKEGDTDKIGTINHNSDSPLPLMSTVKVPVMVEVFYQVKEGKLTFDDKIQSEIELESPPSGVLCYQNRRQYSIKELLYLMISISDNTATDMLLETIGLENVRKRMREKLGYKTFQMHTNIRGLWLMSYRRHEKLMSSDFVSEWADMGYKEKRKFVAKVLEENKYRHYLQFTENRPICHGEYYDELAFMANLVDNRCSAREMNNLMGKIARGEIIDKMSCRDMLKILGEQQCEDGLGLYFPYGTVDYRNKTGGIWGGNADTGIIRIPGHQIVVTMQATKISRARSMEVKKQIGILGEKILYDYANNQTSIQ